MSNASVKACGEAVDIVFGRTIIWDNRLGGIVPGLDEIYSLKTGCVQTFGFQPTVEQMMNLTLNRRLHSCAEQLFCWCLAKIGCGWVAASCYVLVELDWLWRLVQSSWHWTGMTLCMKLGSGQWMSYAVQGARKVILNRSHCSRGICLLSESLRSQQEKQIWKTTRRLGILRTSIILFWQDLQAIHLSA